MDLDRKFGEEYIKTHNGTRKENTHENGGGKTLFKTHTSLCAA